MRYVNLVGIELEGGFDVHPDNQDNTEFHQDGSVNIRGEDTSDVVVTGEAVIENPVTLPKALEWMDKNYPSVTNDTCGLHVHLSVRREAHYVCLTSPKFWKAFKEWAKAWGEGAGLSPRDRYWYRLAGRHEYCGDSFDPDSQFNTETGSARYRQLNFAWMKHGTLECRLFPCWQDSAIAKSAVESYVNFVENWLVENFPKFKLKVNGLVLDDAPQDTPRVLRMEEVCVS